MLLAFLELSVETEGDIVETSAGVLIRECAEEFSEVAKVRSGPENSIQEVS